MDLSWLPGREEECVPLLEGHGRAELGLLVVVAQVGDLVQVTGKREKRALNLAPLLVFPGIINVSFQL